MSFIKRLTVLCAFCFIFLQTANASWTKKNSGTLAWLHSVYFVDDHRGWIAGSNGTLLTTDDGGASWKQTKKFNDDNIRDVYFADAQNGWLLCERDVYGGDVLSPSYLLKTSDGGANWERVQVLNQGRERVVKIFFTKNENGFAVGEAGAIWQTTDDKSVWKKLTLPVRYLMLDGAFADNLHGSLVGGGGTTLFTEDGGLTWNPAAVDRTNAAVKLNSIFFVNKNVGWTVGGQGRILFTNNAGKLWHEQNSNVSNNLFDIFFVNTAEGWAVGDDGAILHTTTAGNVWNAEATSDRHKLEKVFFIGQKGFAVGFGGTLLVYDRTRSDVPSVKPQTPLRRAI